MSQTVLVIKEEAVLAVSGREGASPQIKELDREEFTGYGEAVSRWKEGIGALKERMDLSQVRIVLPASVCTSKVIELPWVKKKELKGMAVREMQETFRSEIMDYAVIRNDRKTGILLSCVSVEESVLKQLLDVCAELKIEVKSVTAPMEGLLRILPRIDTYHERTAVYLFFEEGAVTSVLSENGRYKYSSRSRLFSEPGTLDYGTEIVRNVSGILQFHATSKSENVITDVCYAGCPDDVFEVSREGLANMNLNISKLGAVGKVRLPAGNDISEWLSCAAAMLNGVRGVHDINLLASYKRMSEKEERETAVWKHALIPAAASAVCGLVWAGVLVMNVRTQKEIDRTVAWMESASVKKAYEEAKSLEREKERLTVSITQMKETDEDRATYPQIDSSVLSRIQDAGGAKITSDISGYDSESGQMKFKSRSQEAIDIPAYIRRLTQTDLFHTVEYTGYVFENDAYTLSLLCTLKAADDVEVAR